MNTSESNEMLLESARAARVKAYAPYSGYTVGAAVLGNHGNVWTGCNVENVSYGASICAERTAIVKIVSEGCKEIQAIAVSTADGGTPCGICLQVLLEFSPDPNQMQVYTISDEGRSVSYVLSDLIPHGFSSDAVIRTKGE